MLNQFNVNDVVLDKLLKVFLVELSDRIVFRIGQLLLTEFDKGNMVETIRLLVHIGEGLVEVEVVDDGDTIDMERRLITTHLRDSLLLDLVPRRDLLRFVFTKHSLDTIYKIRNVKELDVPTSHDVREILLPVVDETLKHLFLSEGSVNRDVFAVSLKLTETKHVHLTSHQHTDSDHLLFGIIYLWESILTLGFDVDVCHTDLRHIILDLIRELVRNERIDVIRVAEDAKPIDVLVLLHELSAVMNGARLNWLQTMTVERTMDGCIAGARHKQGRMILYPVCDLLSVFIPAIQNILAVNTNACVESTHSGGLP